MEHRIETISEKKLAGMRASMSLAHNTTGQLWRAFMGRRKEIQNSIGPDLYSMQAYPPDYFKHFDPHVKFDKWAAVAVSDHMSLLQGIEAITLPGGLYAVFSYKGTAATAPAAFQYIFGTWLPASEYELANRLHFEVLGAKYKNNDPDSEEEIWIPIQARE